MCGLRVVDGYSPRGRSRQAAQPGWRIWGQNFDRTAPSSPADSITGPAPAPALGLFAWTEKLSYRLTYEGRLAAWQAPLAAAAHDFTDSLTLESEFGEVRSFFGETKGHPR